MRTAIWLPCIAIAATVALVAISQAQKSKTGGSKLKFRALQLRVDNNEGCDVGDINKDGHPDVVAGEFWYAGPEFQPHPVRKLLPFGEDYLENNGEHLFDVDGDGWLDVVSGSFQQEKLTWHRNPGPGGWDQRWKAFELADTGRQQNEVTMMHDMDGDGRGEVVVNSWNKSNPLLAWKIAADGSGTAARVEIGPAGEATNGHGMGFGDVNGDGLEDIVFMNGWYERPPEGAMEKPWQLHADWEFPHASCPMLVLDLDADGRNDILWGDGHNYGLYWLQQREPAEDGTTNWRMHTIDKTFSQPHALVWEDLDGDGKPELITGKRVRAHSGRDPGGMEEAVINIYRWNPADRTFGKEEIHRGQAGIGLQIRVADMNADSRPDIVVAGKSGTHILFNEGGR